MKSIVSSILVAMTAGSVFASPIYFQDFVGTESGNQPLTHVNWNSQYGMDGTTWTGTGSELGAMRGFHVIPFLFFNGTELTNGTPFLAWTDDANFGTFEGITEVGMAMNFGDNANPVRIALEVDGAWYVSQSTLKESGWVTNSISIQSESWNSLSFSPDVILSMGGAVAAPSGSGNVTAVGILGSRTTAAGPQVRIKDFAVIPEPGTLGLFALSVLGIFAVRRYRLR